MVDHVILFDFPLSITDFIHRAGRTGRFNTKGKVSSIITKKDKILSDQILHAIRKDSTFEGIKRDRSTQIKFKKNLKREKYQN